MQTKSNKVKAGERTHKIEVIMGDGSETPAAVREAVERKISEMPCERTQHTPGPWNVDEWEYATRGKCLVIETAHDAVAEIKTLYRPDTDSIHEELANARLIAAAPELLEALKFIADRENLTFAECSDAEEIISVAKAAIAKAERKI